MPGRVKAVKAGVVYWYYYVGERRLTVSFLNGLVTNVSGG